MRKILYVYEASEMPFDRYADGVGFVHATGRVAVVLRANPYTGDLYQTEEFEYEDDPIDMPSIGREEADEEGNTFLVPYDGWEK